MGNNAKGKIMEVQRAIGENLRALRRIYGMTQEAAAARIGVHPSYIGPIEKGLKCPSVPLLCRMADAFELHPALLMLKASGELTAKVTYKVPLGAPPVEGPPRKRRGRAPKAAPKAAPKKAAAKKVAPKKAAPKKAAPKAAKGKRKGK